MMVKWENKHETFSLLLCVFLSNHMVFFRLLKGACFLLPQCPHTRFFSGCDALLSTYHLCPLNSRLPLQDQLKWQHCLAPLRLSQRPISVPPEQGEVDYRGYLLNVCPLHFTWQGPHLTCGLLQPYSLAGCPAPNGSGSYFLIKDWQLGWGRGGWYLE